MRQKHAEIAHIWNRYFTISVGSQSVVVKPQEDDTWLRMFEDFIRRWQKEDVFKAIYFKSLECRVPSDWIKNGRPGPNIEDKGPFVFPVIPDQALRLQYIVEAARLRRIPEKSKWAKTYAFASVDAMLIDLLQKGCGTLACELVRYRGSDASDPMDAIVMRVNHEASRAPALEMNFFGFWCELFKSVTLRLPRTARKTLPAWACKTGEVKFSELLPSHQVKAMAAIKRFM